jgi:soluble lytic murein transglycosylase-like protein
MSATKILAACMMLAAQTYDVPPAVLVGIYKAEGGRPGLEMKNQNGTQDLGPMQINTLWIPELSQKWGVSTETARSWVRDDTCTNVGVAAWILRSHIEETGSITQAIAHYHSRTPVHGSKYKARVISILKSKGLVDTGG